MKMMRVLAVVVVLVGFSLPLQAQGMLPVEVVCVKGKSTYQPICKHVKQAVKKSSEFSQAKSGNRYVVLLFAEKGALTDGGIDMSISFAATISDPLSKTFPYLIASIPWVFGPSDSAMLGEAIVDAALPLAVASFSAMVDEINSYGALEKELGEGPLEDIGEDIKSEMEEVLKKRLGTDTP